MVLSQCFERCTFAGPLKVYRALWIINPSPYMIYLQVHSMLSLFSYLDLIWYSQFTHSLCLQSFCISKQASILLFGIFGISWANGYMSGSRSFYLEMQRLIITMNIEQACGSMLVASSPEILTIITKVLWCICQIILKP
jgi:hypothetical protein